MTEPIGLRQVAKARLALFEFAQNHTVDEFLQKALEEAELSSESSIGFFHFVDDDQEHIILGNWSGRTRAEFCKAEGQGSHDPFAEAGVWVDCVRERQPVVHNDYASLPHRKGLPPGHADVVRELVVPVIRGEKIRAIMGVGNKATDYIQDDVETVALIADLAWDIAERKLMEESLRESEERFRVVADFAYDWEYWMGPDGGLLYISPSCERITGHTAQEFEKDRDLRIRIVHPDDVDDVLAHNERGPSAPELGNMEFRICLGNEVRWIAHSCRSVFRDNGEYWGRRVSNRDITERKLAAQALAESEARYRQLFHGNSAIMLISDAQIGKIIEANRAAQEFYGYSADEFLQLSGRNLSALPESENVVLRRDAADRKISRFLVQHRLASGAIRDVQVDSSPIEFAGRKVLYSIIHDVTERMEADRALLRMQAQLQSIMDNSSACIYVKDRQGRLLLVNRQVEALVGLPASEIIGRHLSDFIPGESGPRFEEQDRQIFEGGEASQIEETMPLPHGERTLLTDLFPLRGPGGSIEFVAGISVDITERKLMEELLVAATEAADQANRAKSEFLSRMSHELRTPLNVVLGFGQLLELEDLTPRQSQDVKHILNASSHLLDVIDDILNLSRIDANKLSLSVEPVKVVPVLLDAAALVEPLAARHRVHVEVTDATNAVVLADKQRLKQVFLNLLTNAIKYNREDGSVRTEIAPLEDGRVRISVSDTGHGIPESMVDRLFTPFDRLGAEATGIEGTGLGLSLSRGLAEAMNGTIGVESTVGQGSTFWIDLPVASLPVAAFDEATPGPANSNRGYYGGKTIVYIDDNIGSIEFVERVLESRPGAKLVAVGQGSLGLDVIRGEHIPDLVLLDLNLPDMSGLEVFQEMLTDPATRSIPVVVCSADATESQIRRMLDAGVREYLTKPLKLAKLLQVIDDVLSPGA